MKKYLCFLLIVTVLIVPFPSIVFAEDETYGHVYCRSSSDTKKIALTFDDGPHPRYTLEILQILSEYDIKATFFIIGINAERYPEALQKVVDSGCEIGNHTYSHARMTRLSAKEIRKQVIQCETVLYEKTGVRPCLFRPPEGMIPKSLNVIMQESNYNLVLWSIDTLDWAMNPAKTITQTVLKQLRGGDIILMHDYVSGGNTTCDALRQMIPKILEKGYEFVTVSELINAS